MSIALGCFVESEPQSSNQTSLASQATFAVGWSAAAEVLRQVVQFAILAILAHLLQPDDFGLLGMATTVTGFAWIFSKLGMNPAIIQRRTLESSHLDAAFWGTLLMGSGIALAIVALAPLISTFYREPRLISILRVISLTFVLRSLPATHVAMLQRKLRFREVGVVDLVGALASLVVSVAMAIAGCGVWSLVGGQLIIGPVSFVVVHFYEPWRVQPRFRLKALKDLLSFGLHTSASNVINYASVNLDYLLIGRVLGSEILGIYTIAYQLMQRPLSQLSVVPRALFPIFSGIQTQEDRLVRGYLRSTHYMVLLMFPLMIGVAVLAPEFVNVFFGEKWQAAIPLLQVLCLAGAAKSAGMNIAILFNAKGRPEVGWKWNLFILLLYVLLFPFALRWGAIGVAVTISVASVPLLLLWQAWLTRLIPVSWLDYWNTLKLPLSAAFVMGIVVWALRGFLVTAGLSPVWVLVIGSAVGASTYGGLILLRDRVAINEVITILRSKYARFKWSV